MKKIKIYLSFLAVFALLFTSCSKDEEAGVNPDSDKATLSFGAIVQDLANKSGNKQSDANDLPACSDDTAAYVEIILSHNGTNVVGSDSEPFRVDLVEGQVFTKEVPELELEPGNYSLEHFAVYNSEGDPIWLAPKNGSDYAEFVDNPLPLDISLGAGVKKYVDVSVLCFDDRDVNLYGYLFFEFNKNEAFEYCFFANYCTPEGRHWPAHFSVEISIDGNVLYSADENMNNVGKNGDGDFFADPICFALPDLDDYADDEEYIDYVLTLQDWDGAYGDVEQMVIQGSLSRNEVVANFDGDSNVYYDHQRFGCGEDQQPMDSDGDGVDDSIDQCPGTETGVEVDATGCPVNQETDTDGDGVIDSIDECPDTEMGVQVDDKGCPVQDGDSDNDGVADSIDECDNTPSGADVNEVGCPLDSDEDGVFDGIDQCPDTESGVTVDADGCPVVAECSIEGPDSSCSEAYLEGDTGWVAIPDPGELPDPYFLYAEGDTSTSLGSVTVSLENGNPVIFINDAGLDDYLVEVSQNSDGSGSVCQAAENIDPPATQDDPEAFIEFSETFTYPFYVRIQANVCP